MSMEQEKQVGGKFKHFTNNPFTFRFQGVEVEVDDKGKIRLVQNHPDGTYDEINCTLALINRIIRTSHMTRTVEWKDEPYRGEDE